MPGPATMPDYLHHQVHAGEAILHVVELPSKSPPAVFLHGIGMDWRVWQATSRRLSEHFHLYLVDLRGHGESSKPVQGYSLAHYAADIEELLDRLDLRGVIVIGSSLGAMVAIAMEVPIDIVRGRVLVDPPLTGGPCRDPQLYADILALKRQPVEVLSGYLSTLNPGSGRFFPRIMSEMWHQTADGVVEEMLKDPQYFNVADALRWNESPTLLLQADPSRGGVLTDEQARRALAVMPHGRLTFVQGAGHAIHADKPIDFTRLVLDFERELRTTRLDGEALR